MVIPPPAESIEPTRMRLRREMGRGCAAMLPIALGYIPFGLLLGASVSASKPPIAAWTGSFLIYGGSAHLTLLQLLQSGSGLAAVVGAALLINVRLIVYSSALAPVWRTSRGLWKALAAATIVDPTWIVAERRATEPGGLAERRAHFAGTAVCLTVVWIFSITAGTLFGSIAGLSTPLTIAVPLCLAAIVAPHLRNPGGAAAVAAGSAMAVVARSWPAGYGIPAAMVAAALAGAAWSGRRAC